MNNKKTSTRKLVGALYLIVLIIVVGFTMYYYGWKDATESIDRGVIVVVCDSNSSLTDSEQLLRDRIGYVTGVPRKVICPYGG